MQSTQPRPRSPRPFATSATLAAALGAAVALGACADATTAPITPPSAAATVPPSASMATWQSTTTPASVTTRLGNTLCVDVFGGGSTPGTRVGIWTCNGQPNQQFAWQADGTIRYGALCLDASGGAGRNGDAIIVWTCNGGANQRWSGTADGQVVGINGRCLDLPGGKTTPGTGLILWDCNGGTNQRWDEHLPSVGSTAPAATGGQAAVLAFMGASNVQAAAALQAKGGVYARYESDFASYANSMWAADSTSFEANFYDRAMIYYVWWARTGNATYLDRANKLAVAARSYIQSQNYYPQAYNMMIDGVALHALVTGDQQSAATVAKTADAMAAPNTYWSYVVGDSANSENDSRTQARVLGLVLDAYLLKVASPAGLNYASRLTDLENKTLNTQAPDGGFHWRNQCGSTKPWMTGMLNDELIRYYTSFQADSRIVSSVKRSADYAWNVDWVASANAFKYMDADCSTSGEGSGATADLNNLISSSYAFVAKQTGDASYYTKGDAAFSGGVYGAWLAGTKQFNQEYTASYRFLSLRF